MNRKENKLNIIYAGRYSENNILSGPELTAKSIFEEHCSNNTSEFIQYFFDGRKYSIFKKLFGKEELKLGKGTVLTLGIFRIIPMLRKFKPDIIHLITFERFALILFVYRMIFKVNIVYNSHGVIQYENTVLKKSKGFLNLKDKFCERIFMKYSGKVIFPSVSTLDLAEKYYNFDETKAVILPNGVLKVFYSKKIKSASENNLKAVILHKNILNNSGIEFLFYALSKADFVLDIYIITNSEISIPQNSNINYCLAETMAVSLLADFYSDKDIFLSLNSYDTFSISTAEAMASGLIPVITNETGISRYIDSGINGFTFDHNNKEKFLEILNSVINLRDVERLRISNAVSDTMSNLSWGNVYEMYSEIYREMVK